jgi:hypothetical protein
MILVQEIRSLWTKASRGGGAAARRNSVPEAAPFPAAGSESAARKILHQILVYGEANNFAGPIKSEIVEAESDSLVVGCVKINVTPERLAVTYEYEHKSDGANARHGGRGEHFGFKIVGRAERGG